MRRGKAVGYVQGLGATCASQRTVGLPTSLLYTMAGFAKMESWEPFCMGRFSVRKELWQWLCT